MPWVETPIVGFTQARGVWGVSVNEAYACDAVRVAKWNGTAWTIVYSEGISLHSVWASSSTNVWAAGAFVIVKSADGGATWTVQTPPEAGANITRLWGLNATTMYATGSAPGHASRVWQTVDGGATWTAIYDDTSGTPYNGIFGYSANEVYFVTQSDKVLKWTGTAMTVVQAATNTETAYACWGPVPGEIYWVTDVPTLPLKQIEHAVGGVIYQENLPFVTNGGTNPTIELMAIGGKDASTIYAGGLGTTTLKGAHMYKLTSPSSSGSGTWLEETLPATAIGTSGLAGVYGIWVDLATGSVIAIAQNGVGAVVSYTLIVSSAPVITGNVYKPAKNYPPGTTFQAAVAMMVDGLATGVLFDVLDEGYYEISVMDGTITTINPIVVVDPAKLRINLVMIDYDGRESVVYRRLRDELPVTYPHGKVAPNYATSEYRAKVMTDRAVLLELRLDNAGGDQELLGYVLAKGPGVWYSTQFSLPRGKNKVRAAVVMNTGPAVLPQ